MSDLWSRLLEMRDCEFDERTRLARAKLAGWVPYRGGEAGKLLNYALSLTSLHPVQGWLYLDVLDMYSRKGVG